MTDITFPEPVVLNLPDGPDRKVATAFEALECLERQWPQSARDSQWRRALFICRDTLDGWRSGVEARRHFLAAAIQAGLVADGHRHAHRHAHHQPARQLA